MYGGICSLSSFSLTDIHTWGWGEGGGMPSHGLYGDVLVNMARYGFYLSVLCRVYNFM